MTHYIINLDSVKHYNVRTATPNLAKTAIIVIEMQETFRRDMNIISDSQINNIKSLIRFGKMHNSKIIYIRHNDSNPNSGNMIKWWNGDKIERESSGWKIIKELDTTGYLIIDKSQYSSFYQTNLEEVLQQHHIEDVIITGVMTNCCCETAARDAFMRGFNVFFISDATATINEELHVATLKNLAFGFAYIKNTSDILSVQG